MRRVLQFCAWKARWWQDQITERSTNDPLLTAGLSAYANQQAAMEEEIALTWKSKWAAVRTKAAPIIELVLGDKNEVIDDSMASPSSVEIEIEDENNDADGGSDCDAE